MHILRFIFIIIFIILKLLKSIESADQGCMNFMDLDLDEAVINPKRYSSDFKENVFAPPSREDFWLKLAESNSEYKVSLNDQMAKKQPWENADYNIFPEGQPCTSLRNCGWVTLATLSGERVPQFTKRVLGYESIMDGVGLTIGQFLFQAQKSKNNVVWKSFTKPELEQFVQSFPRGRGKVYALFYPIEGVRNNKPARSAHYVVLKAWKSYDNQVNFRTVDFQRDLNSRFSTKLPELPGSNSGGSRHDFSNSNKKFINRKKNLYILFEMKSLLKTAGPDLPGKYGVWDGGFGQKSLHLSPDEMIQFNRNKQAIDLVEKIKKMNDGHKSD